MLGGPLYQAYRRAHLSGDGLELLHRRLLFVTLFAWLPLLILSVIEGFAWSGVKVPFLRDIETHARLLIALPLLIVAERVVHERMPVVVRQFVESGIVREREVSRFEQLIASALRLRNSFEVELLLVIFVYAVGIAVIWRQGIALPVATWYRTPSGASMDVSVAGWWYLLVSVPIFQFLLFRWYFRLLVWTRFLWQMSRLNLALQPLHPDRVAGLGPLGELPKAFAPLVAAHGALLAGMLADGIFFTGMTLPQYKLEIFIVVIIVVLLVIGPLFVFIPLLARVKREGLHEYGMVAQRYVREFDRKWIRGNDPNGEALMGSADIQSLADLGNSFEKVEDMQFVPVTKTTVLYLVAVAVSPVAPLLLTMISVDELLTRLVKMVF